MYVKICGITSREDALMAVDAGADFLGFNFYPGSARYLTVDRCARIQAGLADRDIQTLKVGVFVNASLATIHRVMADCALDLAQLHGDEAPTLLAELGEQGFKAIRPATPGAAIRALNHLPRRSQPPACLVDANRPGVYGGSGQRGDWALARIICAEAPAFLAGGLRPENIAEAIKQVQPWGVDVASGVESAPGVKDTTLLKRFIALARSTAGQLEREADAYQWEGKP